MAEETDAANQIGSAPSSSSTTTSVHVTALDAIVNVNSLFTIAVFIGLSFTASEADQGSGISRSRCFHSANDVRRLIVYEVVSFSFFLYSSLIAQGLKLTINLLISKIAEAHIKAEINSMVLRFGMVGSALGSVMGCVFLMLSMIKVVEVKLGVLSCGGQTVWAITTMIVLVSVSLFVYVSTAVYAILQF